MARRALSIVAADEVPCRRCLAYSRKPEEKIRSSAPPSRGIEAGERHVRPDQLRLAAKDLLDRDQTATAARDRPDRDLEGIVQPSRLPVLDVQAMDHEHDAVFTFESGQREPQRRQP